MKGLVNEISG